MTYSVAIREMPTEERPRERLDKHGPAALTLAELLAIQLRVGTQGTSAIGIAEQLILTFDGLKGVSCASIDQLSQIRGIGKVKAIEIAAAVELGKRLHTMTQQDRTAIRCPADVARLLLPEIGDAKQEHLKAVLLDTKQKVLRIVSVTCGTLDSSLVHPREVFRAAIEAAAHSVIVVHNHPSGDPTPSHEDEQVTKRLREAGTIIGIELLDHIILGDNRWVSLKERGLF